MQDAAAVWWHRLVEKSGTQASPAYSWTGCRVIWSALRVSHISAVQEVKLVDTVL